MDPVRVARIMKGRLEFQHEPADSNHMYINGLKAVLIKPTTDGQKDAFVTPTHQLQAEILSSLFTCSSDM